MKNNYYFLTTALTDLQIGHPPEMSFRAFAFILKVNLTEEDYAKTTVIRRYYDIKNILAFWLKEDFDQRGNFNESELEDALLTQGFPEYVYSFLDKYQRQEDRIHYFPSLIQNYFQYEIEQAEGFLKEYLTFEREWRLVLTGFRAKLINRDLENELQFENPYDEVVAQILAQKDSKSYEPPTRYSDLKTIFETYHESPIELYQALCEYRFRKIGAMYGIDLFSIDRILGYLAQLIIVEKWLELDKKKGLEFIERIVKEAS